MSIMQPNLVGFAASVFRKTTGLHKQLGSRVVRVAALPIEANEPTSLLVCEYGAPTIDRIIGVYLNVQTKAAPGTITLQDTRSGWRMDIAAATNFGAYWFNLETVENMADIVITSTVEIVINYTLFNFEIVPASIGHE